MRIGGGWVMHEDVLPAVPVEVHHPRVFLVGHGDLYLLRPPGEQVRPRHAEKDMQFFPALLHQKVREFVAGHIPDQH